MLLGKLFGGYVILYSLPLIIGGLASSNMLSAVIAISVISILLVLIKIFNMVKVNLI